MKTRYFFDIRSEGNLYPDEEGLELANEKAAEIEAANTLAGLARHSEVMRGRLDVAIEVRSTTESLFCAALIHQMNRTRHRATQPKTPASVRPLLRAESTIYLAIIV
jgi:uncharacterized protein DUF6894